MVYYIKWVLDVKSNLHFWDESHLIMVHSYFCVLLVLVC